MDTFTITNYVAIGDLLTFNATVSGVTYTGLKVTGVPHDTVEDVKKYLKKYMDAYTSGKTAEQNRVRNFPPEVLLLIGVPTTFN